MSDVAIRVENLSKVYRLGLFGTGTISHDLKRWWHNIRGKEDPYAIVGQINDRTSKAKDEYVWALKDINFEVKKGEILGIIGRNGAGKSTLLKILSKVTGPTKGKIEIFGRIAALLEVGTGFHAELTGRENIYLNGAILGMTKKEISKKFDEIVDFSGCEMYIDTPVKRYSSGMVVRLGFAVAAYLEPEILIVDEVLAVGDAEFQQKCIGKMKDVSLNEGRTVLFVSHNMAAVKNLCTRGIFLQNREIRAEGNIREIIDQYLAPIVNNPNGNHEILQGIKYYCDYLRINNILINGSNNSNIILDKLKLQVEIEFLLTFPSVMEVEFHLKKGEELVASFANFVKHDFLRFKPGYQKLLYQIDLPILLQGFYQLEIDFTHPLVKGLASIKNSVVIENINPEAKAILNNEMTHWSKVILNGRVLDKAINGKYEDI